MRTIRRILDRYEINLENPLVLAAVIASCIATAVVLFAR